MTYQFAYTDKIDASGKSSWIEAVYYSTNDNMLSVVTDGKHYVYRDVPAYVYDKAKNGSVGRWYNYTVQGQYHAAWPGHSPDEPVVYIQTGRSSDVPKVRGQYNELVTPLPTNPELHSVFEINASFEVVNNVSAASLEDAIEEFRANVGRYIKVDVKGVQLIDN